VDLEIGGIYYEPVSVIFSAAQGKTKLSFLAMYPSH